MQSIKDDCPAGTPPPVIARGWSTDARIIISLAWQTVPPTHSLPPTWRDALLLFLLLTRLLSSKTFCDRKLFPIHSGIIYPSPLDELQLLLQVESSSHFNPNHDNKLPLNLLLLLSLLLFLSCCCFAGQVHFEFTFAFALPTSKVVFIVAAVAVFITLTVCHAHTQAHGQATTHLPHRPVA